jgi:hypothetical protein
VSEPGNRLRGPVRPVSGVPSVATVNGACDTGICGGDVPPLIGQVLTGTGLTLPQAAARLERGALSGLTDVQRRIVEDYVLTRAGG